MKLHLLCLTLFSLLTAWTQVNVLTVNYGNERTNANLEETVLLPAVVTPGEFGKLFTLHVDGQVYAQPLYASGVNIGGGLHNVLYVMTMHDTVYAFDADPAPVHVPLWRTSVGPPAPAAMYTSRYYYTDIMGEAGILSTPVIDPGSGTIYLVADNLAGDTFRYVLHALDMATGQEKNGGPVVIQASIAGQAPDGQSGTVRFDASQHLQRPGLALVNGAVYLAFGSHADSGIYHGWILAYNAANISEQVAVFNDTRNGQGGSIWQSGHGLATDGTNLYTISGNGDFDGSADFGETFLKISAAPGMPLSDWFTPDNWADLNAQDADLGACGPILVPGTSLLLGGGKSGTVYLLDRTKMGHLQNGNPQAIQSFAAVASGIYDMALWNRGDGPILYVQGFGEPVKAYRLTGGKFETSPFTQGDTAIGIPYEGMALSADGDANGILWTTSGEGSASPAPGTLHAYDASDLSNELWNSDMDAGDDLGAFAKFVSPTVANGRVYVPTFSNQVVVYGPKSAGAGALDQITIVNGASYQAGPISPSELVTIFGNGIGPSTPASVAPDAPAPLPTDLGGTQVLFNGQAATVLYASSIQVNALVPDSISGASAVTVQVQYQGETSKTASVPAATAQPGLFTADGSGAGQGLIMNEDFTYDSGENPASAGSTIVLFATGLGQTDPPDGTLSSNADAENLPQPLLTPSVTIGGVQAEVVYAGAAPGLLPGVFEIFVRVPPGAGTGLAQVRHGCLGFRDFWPG